MKKQVVAGLALWMLMACTSASAATWIETGSAGRLPSTAQRVSGVGPATGIFGDLRELTEVDMYLIWITDPLAFSASTIDSVFAVPDPQLFLFDSAGYGVYMNDDAGGSQSALPAAHPSGPMTVGLYYLAISRFNNDPLSVAGSIFPTDVTDTVGPTGPGGASPVIAWNDDVLEAIDFATPYGILLTGVTAVPEPATMLLSGLGLLAAFALRRRR